ncbi:MAG: hypothetical protein E3J69_11220 [Anaerolineales bacterium]|nr:MAG: hypothetical protein E3J69_11220 [Anaerolineales bacterium]
MFEKSKIMVRAAALIALALVASGCDGGTPPPCSTDFLIVSINNANSNGPGTDTIDLDPGCVYELGIVDNTIDGNNGLPSITSSIVINGNKATIRRSTGAQKSAIRLFHISPGGDLVLNDVILLDGLGMEPTNVTDTIRNSGGAIFNDGDLTVNNSLITANHARRKGGGIYNAGTMTINTSTIRNNETNIGNEPDESGGGILNTGTATIIDSTIANNIASQSAGGIGNSGDLTITNSTISGNSTTLSGIVSGAAIINAGNATISYTTIANNTGTTAGAVFSAPDTIQISNSIIADNIGGDCSYPATSPISGPNLDSDGSCIGFTITASPQLDPLAFNGGPTQTHSIAPSSPAKNAAAGSCPAADQRGEPRPHGAACDLGSFELSGGGSQASDSSTLSGLVFDDSNTNGIFEPGESGFAGVELLLESGACLAPGSAVSELSAADGSFQFEIFPPTAGAYCLSIDPLTPANDTILIPGGFTVPPGGEMEITLTEGEDLSDLLFGWDFQFAGSDLQPNPVITNVVLNTTTPPGDSWVEVEVTVENQGAYPAENYDLVLIPHYGWGPPNPGGYASLPDLLPGFPHTETFTPGVLYGTTPGTFTLRVLVTDDWYALGDPDSTGTAGDYQDFTITVLESLTMCNPFEGIDYSLFLLSIEEDIMVLPVYITTEGVAFPGLFPEDDSPPAEYHALLGDIPSNACELQGFDDRLYCMFTLTPEMPGAVRDFQLYKEGCEDPVVTQPSLLLPELELPLLLCTIDLGPDDCVAAGGEMSKGLVRAPYCICP